MNDESNIEKKNCLQGQGNLANSQTQYATKKWQPVDSLAVNFRTQCYQPTQFQNTTTMKRDDETEMEEMRNATTQGIYYEHHDSPHRKLGVIQQLVEKT